MRIFFFTFLIVSLLYVPLVTLAVTDSFTVSVEVTATDNEAPTVPANVSASAVSTSQIDVSWDASTDSSGVDGYQVFRNSTQIATTASSTLTYSDTGLSAATTYEYFIRAFDAANNISSSSATTSATTYSVAAAATSTPTVSGGYVSPSVSGIKLLVSADDSQITFSANAKIGYSFRWGKSMSYELGALRSIVKKNSHTIYLPILEPGTTYYYRLVVTDQFDRQVEVIENSFSTPAEELPSVIPNAANFFTERMDDSNAVKLEWVTPSWSGYKVRLVANPNFYPRHIADGYVVYEGRADTVVDSDALLQTGQMYYTLFVVDELGNSSSGVVSSVAKEVPSEAEVVDEPKDIILGDFEDVIFRQGGIDRIFRGEIADVLSQQEFVVLVPEMEFEPQYTVLRLSNEFSLASYLMEHDYDQGFYTTGVPALVAGEYAVLIQMYDRQGRLLAKIDGVLHVKSPEKLAQPIPSALAVGVAGTSTVFLILIWLLAGIRLLWRLRADN